MLAHINCFFDLRLLKVLLLYYYCSQVLDKYPYYILCTFLYLAHERAFWLVKITSRVEVARYLKETERVEPSWLAIPP
jgi:capsule polysaccharide modification protein KpsS